MTDEQFTRVRVFLYGQVQGIGLRASTVKKAEKLGVTGWIRNLSDGRVEALAVGKSNKVEQLLEWLENDPSSANVEKLEVVTKEEINYNPFEDEFKINPTI